MLDLCEEYYKSCNLLQYLKVRRRAYQLIFVCWIVYFVWIFVREHEKEIRRLRNLVIKTEIKLSIGWKKATKTIHNHQTIIMVPTRLNQNKLIKSWFVVFLNLYFLYRNMSCIIHGYYYLPKIWLDLLYWHLIWYEE